MTFAIPIWSIWLVGAVAYLTCSVLAYGSTLAHFQRKFADLAKEQYRSDKGLAVFVSILGPLGLAVSLVHNRPFSGFMFRLRPPPRAFLKPLKKKWWERGPMSATKVSLRKAPAARLPWEEFLRCTICLRPQ